MENIILIVHYFVCIFLVVTILLQAGKGADIGAVFGGGGSSTVFGSRGAATFLSKLTTGMAIVFLLTSISLAYYSRQGTSSILEKVPASESAIPPVQENQVNETAPTPGEAKKESE